MTLGSDTKKNSTISTVKMEMFKMVER